MVPVRIIFHHTADASKSNQFDKVNAYHKTRDFPFSRLGFYVGYHYFIERDGSIRQAREEDEIGAHDQGENLNSIGVCFAGNFDIEYPTEQQWTAYAKIIGEIRARHPIPINRIEPHRLDDATSCPGKNVPDDALIKEYLRRSPDPLLQAFGLIGVAADLL